MKKLSKFLTVILALSLCITGFVFTTAAVETEVCSHNYVVTSSTRTLYDVVASGSVCCIYHIEEYSVCSLCGLPRYVEEFEQTAHQMGTVIDSDGSRHGECLVCHYRVS